MKKTKLFTSLVAFALVLGLGACSETNEECDTCPVCSESNPSVTEPDESDLCSEHTYGSYINDDNDNHCHVRVCEVCGYRETSIHQLADEDSSTCKYCGATGLNSKGLSYELNDDNASYYVSAYKMSQTASDLYIPETYLGLPVTAIGSAHAESSDDAVFLGNSNGGAANYIKFIALPDSIVAINAYAFHDCYSVNTIEIPETVMTYGVSAFRGCNSLTSPIVLQEGITEVSEYLFYDCYSLTSITLPSTIETIGRYAFYYCGSLERLDIPSGVTSIGDNAFSYCRSIKELTLPDGLTDISEKLLYECASLVSISIPSGVTSIGTQAFCYCRSLSSLIVIPEGVSTLTSSVFMACNSLTSIVIAKSVTSISSQAFRDCVSLRDVFYKGDSDDWDKVSISSSSNAWLTSADRYYYDPDGSLTEANPKGDYWCYDNDGNIITW